MPVFLEPTFFSGSNGPRKKMKKTAPFQSNITSDELCVSQSVIHWPQNKAHEGTRHSAWHIVHALEVSVKSQSNLSG